MWQNHLERHIQAIYTTLWWDKLDGHFDMTDCMNSCIVMIYYLALLAYSNAFYMKIYITLQFDLTDVIGNLSMIEILSYITDIRRSCEINCLSHPRE